MTPARVSLNGNVVTTGDDFDTYRYSLDRTVRKSWSEAGACSHATRRAFQIIYRQKTKP